jgi:hypothetical protein
VCVTSEMKEAGCMFATQQLGKLYNTAQCALPPFETLRLAAATTHRAHLHNLPPSLAGCASTHSHVLLPAVGPLGTKQSACIQGSHWPAPTGMQRAARLTLPVYMSPRPTFAAVRPQPLQRGVVPAPRYSIRVNSAKTTYNTSNSSRRSAAYERLDILKYIPFFF